MVFKIRLIAPYGYFTYAGEVASGFVYRQDFHCVPASWLTGLGSEGLASGGDRAGSYPSMLTSIKKPQRQLWRGGSWKYWMKAVMLQFTGKDYDSSDEFSTLANGSIIGVWSQHSLETWLVAEEPWEK